MQTHLSEQTDEIAWVRELFPTRVIIWIHMKPLACWGTRLYGHAIHLEPREMDRLAEVGASVVHCPTSNTFIGSGLFNTAGMMAHGINAGLATDTGGGSSFSMLRTMAAAYEIAQLRGVALHPAQLYGWQPADRHVPCIWTIRLATSRQEWLRIWWCWIWHQHPQLHNAAPAPRIFGKKFSHHHDGR